MYNSQYYTCEQIDERLLQGYLDDYNSQTGQSLTKAQFLTKLRDAIDNFVNEGEIKDLIESYVSHGDMYGGLATPSGTPQLPEEDQAPLFFIAISPGTYINYGNLTISKPGFHIILWDTDTWSVQQNILEIEQVLGESTVKLLSQKAITDFLSLTTDSNVKAQIGYYECDTAGATAAKTIAVASYALFVGGSMKVKFVNKNTANNATLNINSQGAKALYYQGERASSTNSWDEGEVVEIYYDGTNYYANNVKGGSGSGVYDVSVEHPTSGPNEDGKFTLEYILNPSNVNELIPVNQRYPGMSIQFVSTSDNNYAQFRYMGTDVTTAATFTNTANWQGVDNVPTAGSHNLIESGGVDLRTLQNDIYLKSLNDIKRVGFIASNNTWHGYEGAGFCIPTEGITSLAITKKSNSGPNYYAFLTTNVYETGTLSYCSGYSARIQLAKNVPLTSFPDDCKYIWVIAATGSATLSLDDADFGLVINGVNMNGNFYAHIKEFVKDVKNGIGFAFPVGGEFEWDSSTLTLTIPATFDIVSNISSGKPSYQGSSSITFPTTGVRAKLLLFNAGTLAFEIIDADASTAVILGKEQIVLGIVDTTTGNEYFNFPYKKNGYDIIRNGYDSVPTVNSNKLLTSGVIKNALDSVTGNGGLLGNAFHGDYLSLAPFLFDYIDSVYWPREQSNFNSFLTTVKGRSGYKIAFITDTHEGGLAAASGESALRTIALYNKLSEAKDGDNQIIDFCMHGGDISNDYGASVNRYFAYMQEVMKMFHVPSNKNLLIAKGNHDADDSEYREVSPLDVDWENGSYFVSYDNETFTSVTKDTYRGGELYIQENPNSLLTDSLFRFIQATNAPGDAVWGEGAYYYWDVQVQRGETEEHTPIMEDAKIRVIVDNTECVNDQGVSDNSERWTWLAETALNLSSKGADAPNWLVVVLRHRDATSNAKSTTIFNAFMNGSHLEITEADIDYGYVNGGGIRLLCLHGHEHGSAGYSNAQGYLDLGFKNAGVKKSGLGTTTNYALYAITISTANDNKKLIVDSLLPGYPVTYDYDDNIVELSIGQSILMARSGLPKQNQCSWSSTDPNIAEVSNGVVTGVSAGTTTITGTGNSKTVSYTVKVVSSNT